MKKTQPQVLSRQGSEEGSVSLSQDVMQEGRKDRLLSVFRRKALRSLLLEDL